MPGKKDRGARCGRFRWGWVGVTVLWVGSGLLATASAEDPPATPNVLLIYADDLNMDLATFGHPTVRTPNLDRLAARGVRFSRSYCPLPLCLPSRVSLMTGQRPNRTGCFLNSDLFTDDSLNGVPLLPCQFRSNGYVSGSAGKVFHDGMMVPEAWDESYNDWDDPWVEQPADPGNPKILYWGPFENGEDGSLGKKADTKSVERVIDMLQRFRGPFFLAMGFRSPHNPFVYPERFATTYDPESDVPPLPPEEESVNWEADGIDGSAYISQNCLDPAYENDPETGRREAIAAYWRMITWMDEEVGRLLDALDQSGQTSSTIIVFVSDNGLAFGTHARYGKFNLYEEDVRTPLLISVPWLASTHGAVCEVPVEHIDLYPTLMELCALPEPSKLQGESLVPFLHDVSFDGHPPAVSLVSRAWYANIERMVCSSRYKFVYWETGKHMLFDFENDPGEYFNRFNDAGYEEIVEQHMRMLDYADLLDADWNLYSNGFPGTLGVPGISLTEDPELGSNPRMKLKRSSLEPQVGILLTGRFADHFTLSFGCTVLVRPTFLTPLLLSESTTELPLAIPDDPIYGGLSIVSQLLQADPGADGGFAASRGLRLFLLED